MAKREKEEKESNKEKEEREKKDIAKALNIGLRTVERYDKKQK